MRYAALLLLLFCNGSKLSASISLNAPESPLPVRLAPGEVRAFLFSGLTNRLDVPIRATIIPLPSAMNGISLRMTIGSTTYQLPLFGIEQFSVCDNETLIPECRMTSVVAQVPFEIGSGSGTPTGSLQLNENGFNSPSFRITIVPDRIHILRACDLIFVGGDHSENNCQPLVTHPDGTLVSGSSPARDGEIVTLYATGLGLTDPLIPSGTAAGQPPPRVGDVTFTAAIAFDFSINAGPSRPELINSSSRPQAAPEALRFIGLSLGYVGLYQVNIQVVRSGAFIRPCLTDVTSNLTISFRRFSSFDGAPICVAP